MSLTAGMMNSLSKGIKKIMSIFSDNFFINFPKGTI